ncbi:MAG TPA: polysaccharide biosynthesis C-terminal domain-containing protein [Longimicrobiales bacterium]|nr:polysaccharide biosynthesis C-terminal domain-containing protein [Longimicrobiales bacterium]
MGRTSGIYVAGTLTAKGARFLLIPIYVHLLTSAEVGILIFVEALVVALSRALSLGFGQAVKRFYVEFADERDADEFAAALWWVGFFVALAIGSMLVVASLAFGHRLTAQIPAEYLAIAVVSGMLRSNLGLALERFIVREEPVAHGVFNIGHFGLSAGLSIIFVVALDLGVRGALWGDLIAAAVFNLIVAVIISRGRWPRFQWPVLRKALAYSVPTVPHAMFTWGITFADRLILERFVTLSALAVYGIGYQFASLLPVFSVAFVNAWIPRFFRNAGSDDGADRYSRVFLTQVTAIIAIALPIVAFAPEAIRLITTAEYAGSSAITRMVAIGLIFHGVYQALLLPLFYRNRTGLVSTATGIALASNIALNLLLIPRIGIMGAAVATVGAYLLTSIVVAALVARHYPIPVDYRRLAVIVTLAMVACLASMSFDGQSLPVAIAAKLAMLGIFILPVAFVPGILTPGEGALFRRFTGRGRRARPSVPVIPDIPVEPVPTDQLQEDRV